MHSYLLIGFVVHRYICKGFSAAIITSAIA